jgi:hypothetical protein
MEFMQKFHRNFDFFDRGVTALAISPDGNIIHNRAIIEVVVKTWHRSVISETEL